MSELEKNPVEEKTDDYENDPSVVTRFHALAFSLTGAGVFVLIGSVVYSWIGAVLFGLLGAVLFGSIGALVIIYWRNGYVGALTHWHVLVLSLIGAAVFGLIGSVMFSRSCAILFGLLGAILFGSIGALVIIYWRNGLVRYYVKRSMWFLITLVAAVVLNFILPRLMPGDPLTAIMQRVIPGGGGFVDADAIRRIYEHYMELFGLDRPLIVQFGMYVRNLISGDWGQSFARFPREITDIIASALPWTIGLQLPAIITGWILGNILGALAAYKKSGFDKVLMPATLFVSGIPAFGLAVVLLSVFALGLGWFPVSGGYEMGMIPHFSWRFIASIIEHYHLPFWSIVLISIGGQAIGMRSMSIYELNADYVKYSRFMGIKDRKIVRYVFRNAMLPQVTGLAVSIGTMMGGAIVAEMIFSYPGLGTQLLQAIGGRDFPLITGIALVITVMVLVSVFILEIIYGLIDPRIKATQYE